MMDSLRWTVSLQWKFVLGMWNFTSLSEKEFKLVFETENYGLDIFDLASTQSLGTKGLDQGWPPSSSRVSTGDGSQSGVGIVFIFRMKASQLDKGD